MPEQRQEPGERSESSRPPDRREESPAPAPAMANRILSLQRRAGNRAVCRLVRDPASVTAGEAAAEAGADALAPSIEEALRGGEPGSGVALSPPAAAPTSGSGGYPVSTEIGQEIDSARTGGQPLPADLSRRVDEQLGASLGPVRVHTDERADRLATSLNARAFTSGPDIFFRRGESGVGGGGGRSTLAHELAHVAAGHTGGQVARLADDQRDSLFRRAASLDYQLLTDLAERVPLLVKINGLPKSGDKAERATEQIDREMLKQLVLVSGLSTAQIASLVDTAVSTGDPAPLRQKLRKGKMRSSGSAYKLADDCRLLLNDYYRAEQAKGGGADHRDLANLAKSYDKGGTGELAGNLTHTVNYRKFGLFKKTRTETHTLEDVMGKVSLVGGLDLRHTTSPESMPRVEGGGEGGTPPRRARIGVVGGGPIGLMAALEARVQGADVILFEARTDEYSRRQVLALDPGTIQKFARFGIKAELLKDPDAKGQGNLVAVKYIEKPLRDRAHELGVDIRTGWFLAGSKAGEGGHTTRATFQVGQDKRKARMHQEELDLLVVAAGAGVSKANKYTGGTLGDELGFKFDVKEARDYAVVGLFQSTDTGRLDRAGASKAEQQRWAYRFNTPKVTYVLQQVPAELYKEFQGKDGKEKMEAFIKKVATEHYQMQGATLASATNSKGQTTPNVGMFPIEIQQAQKFVNESLRTLLIGDSAATPHPHTGSGLNTGIRELDALSDVVASIRTDLIMRSQGSGKPKSEDGEVQEDPGIVKSALGRYNTEIKGLTDNMVNKALNTLAGEHAKYLKEAIAGLRATYGGYLASDYAVGGRLDSIEQAVTTITAKDSSWSKDNQLDYLLDAQAEVARIRQQMESLVGTGTGD
jgi:2-polyprenyl-6-methoxyphenol hydroxylase-like FAD-dependent oxidoreductase